MFKFFHDRERLTADKLNRMIEFTLSRIFPGPGIQILPTGSGICIGAAQSGRRGMGVGDSSTVFQMGKFESHDSGGSKINVYLWDGSAWAEETTKVYMPYEFRAEYYDDETITYADGRKITYTETIYPYYRDASWTNEFDETETERQAITMPYAVDAPLLIGYDGIGNLVDMNWAGRHWARSLRVFYL